MVNAWHDHELANTLVPGVTHAGISHGERTEHTRTQPDRPIRPIEIPVY